MANRTFFNTQAVNRELKILSVVAKVTQAGTSEAAGTVSLTQGDPGDSTTPTSIGATATADVRTSGSPTKAVTFTLGDGTNVDKYEALLGVFYTAKGGSAHSHVVSVTDTVDTDGKVVLTFATAPAQNNEFYVTFVLKNTSVDR